MPNKFYKYGNPTGKFAAIQLSVVDTDAWRSLKSASQSLYILIVLEWRGMKYNNNGKIQLSARSAAERMGCSKDTAARAFRDLQAKGFLRVIKGASLGAAVMGKSPEYEIVALSMPSNRLQSNEDFKKWTEGDNFEVFNHPPKNPSGKNKPLS